jgi:hypothetical protein
MLNMENLKSVNEPEKDVILPLSNEKTFAFFWETTHKFFRGNEEEQKQAALFISEFQQIKNEE